MTKKKVLILTLCTLLVLSLLTPMPIRYDDGGTVKYQAALYSVTDYHRPEIDHNTGTVHFKEGLTVKILGIEIYNSYEN